MPKDEQITGTDLFDFAQCNHRVFLNAHGEPELKVPLDAATQRLLEDGVLHERVVIEGFEYEEVPAGTNEEKEKATREMMEKGAPLIYQGLLRHGAYLAKPDFLKRIETASKFGAYSYIPVEIKSVTTPKHEHLYQIYFYCYILELIQGAAPEHGLIINGDKDEIKMVFGPTEREQLLAAVSTIEKIHQQQWTEGPTLISHCRRCPWQKHCLEYMKREEDVSLIHRLGKTDKNKMHEVGIKTITDITGYTADELEKKVESIAGWKLARYRLQAEAMKKGEEILLRSPDFGSPEREIYLDLEIESSYDVCYLFGVLEDTGEFRAFTAEKPEDEEKVWNEFLDYIEKLPEKTTIYHWAPFEVMWMNKLAARYGVSESAQKIFDNNFHDLLKTTEKSVAMPLSSYSLKDVARHLGFDWRDKEIGGALSMLWYLEWLEHGERSKLEQILRYNEDDVRATKWVKDWLVELVAKSK